MGSTELFKNSRTTCTFGIRKQHLPADILQCLGKADNIPFNQPNYIVENYADRYYSKVIETFVAIIKRQLANRQLLLVNTACPLEFLEEYLDRQAQIWKIFHKHHNIPDDLEDLHLHFDDFKTSLETDFRHLKEATSSNVQNIQTSLNVQQTYSSTLGSYVNNIYSKLSELQKIVQHRCMYSHQGNTVQIEAPEFDPDIDGDSPVSVGERQEIAPVQGTLATIPEVSEPEDDNSIAPGTKTDQQTYQETDWPDAPPMQIPRVSSSTAQPPEQGYNRRQVQPSAENFEIPELEENSEEEQFADLDSFMAHHNTYQASEHIQQEYFSHLQDLDDDQYYAKIDRVDFSQSTLAAQDYRLENHQVAPQRSTEELKRIFGRGRGQARQEALHGHQPFGPRTRSLQSCIQCKIKKNQHLHERYTSHH